MDNKETCKWQYLFLKSAFKPSCPDSFLNLRLKEMCPYCGKPIVEDVN